MKTIRCASRLIVTVDDEDYERISAIKWHNFRGYAINRKYVNGKKKALWMHRLILNAPKEFEVDHIDGNRSNNQKSNLRLATHGQNQCNTRKLKANNTNGVKGVYFDKRRGTWYVQITHHKQTHCLGGWFKTKEEAAKRYDLFAKQLHGEFAVLNSHLCSLT